MAYFTAADEIRTLKYLGYSPNDVVNLRNQQTIAYGWFGDAIVTEVESILHDLDTLETLELKYATDASSSLIKADVLEWAPGSRQQNLQIRRQTLLKRLSNIFDLPIQNGGYSGSTPVYRG